MHNIIDILEKAKKVANNSSEANSSYFRNHIFSSCPLEQYQKEVQFLRSLKKDSQDDSVKELSQISNTMAKKVATLLENPVLETELESVLPEPNREVLLTNVIDLVLKKDWPPEEKYDFALRACLGILTEGVVTAPIDGLVSAKIDPQENFPRLIFAGPIRAVGGTNLIYVLMLAEYLRKKLNLNAYVPTEAEVERSVVEVKEYVKKHPGQVRPATEQLSHVVRNCSIMIDGVETQLEEVSLHKRLPRIQKPRIRGALALIFVEGFIIRGRKVLSLLPYYGLDEWQTWIKELILISKTYRKEGQRSSSETKYSLTMGRPLLSVNQNLQGLRLKIGRSPTTGLAGSNVTKELIDLVKFINVGTQLVINCPGKATTITGTCELLAKPIVVYKDGSIDHYTVGRFDDVVEVLDLGQILICTGDFIEYNKVLPVRDYCGSAWLYDTKNEVNFKDLDEKEHLNISVRYPNAKLHPYYALMIDALTFKQYLDLRRHVKNNNCRLTPEIFDLIKKINLRCTYDENSFSPFNKSVFEHYLLLDEELDLTSYYECLEKSTNKNVLGSNLTKYINQILARNKKTLVPEKGYAAIYARVGRSEAVHISKVKPKPFNALVNYKYQIRSNSFWSAIEKMPFYYSAFNMRYCNHCKVETYKRNCEFCNKETYYAFKCDTCQDYFESNMRTLKSHEDHKIKKYVRVRIDYEKELDCLKKKSLAVGPVKEVSKKYPIKPVTETQVLNYEPLIKGYFRSKRGLFTTKDGTIRTTFCNASTTHFKPRDINTTPAVLKTLGYSTDITGAQLVRDDQVVALKFTDCIASYATAQWMLKITQFIDELIYYYYNGPTYYNFKTVEDLRGIITHMLSPHTSNAVLGRIIGFTKNYCVYTHPFAVSCRRRDVDGDIDAIYLSSDMILNSSKKFIPEQKRGALMSVPLTLTTEYHIDQLDKQILSLELNSDYYGGQLSNQQSYTPADLKVLCSRYEDFLDRKTITVEEIGYNVKEFAFDVGNYDNWYKDSFDTAQKLQRFISVTEKLSYLNKKEVYMGLIEGHILPDIVGNLNAFYRQDYKCSFCYKKYPKIPLSLRCPKCKIGTLKPTVYPGMVLKYYPILKFFEGLKYLPQYLTQKIKSLEMVLNCFTKDKKSVFTKDSSK